MRALHRNVERLARVAVLAGAGACSVITDYGLGADPFAPAVASALIDAGAPQDATASSDVALSSEAATFDSSFDAKPAPVCTEVPCVVQLVAAATATCARLSDGAVRCWGRNDKGVVGASTTDDVATPSRVAFDGPVDEIAMGAWGKSDATACALRGDIVECWGQDGEHHRLGRGGATSQGEFVPVPAPVVGLSGASGVAVSANRTCARLGDGGVTCWGRNYALDASVETSPTDFPSPKPVKQLVGGRTNFCALLDTDEIACAGYPVDYREAWGDPAAPWDETFAIVSGVTGVVEVAAKAAHICVLKKGGDIVCWGRNDFGQLGRGTAGGWTMVPAAVTLPSAAKHVGVAGSHSCAVLTDNSVWCWGRNDGGTGGTPRRAPRGQIGALADGGIDEFSASPRKIEGLPGTNVASVVGGYDHSCALLENGAVYCWGSNKHGQLGRGRGDGGAPDDGAHPKASKVLF